MPVLPVLPSTKRGLYYLPWRGTRGELFIAAINRHGQRVLEATVYTQEDRAAVEATLWEILDREDPQPKLKLAS